jgi:hypothetical protein
VAGSLYKWVICEVEVPRISVAGRSRCVIKACRVFAQRNAVTHRAHDGYSLRKKRLCPIQEVTLPFNKRVPSHWYNLRGPERGMPSVNFSVAIVA